MSQHTLLLQNSELEDLFEAVVFTKADLEISLEHDKLEFPEEVKAEVERLAALEEKLQTLLDEGEDQESAIDKFEFPEEVKAEVERLAAFVRRGEDVGKSQKDH